MAVIGARPAQPWFLGWRTARRPRRRTQPARATRRAGVRRRSATRLDVRAVLATIGISAGLGLFYLSQSAQVAATGYQIERLDLRLREAVAQQQDLVTAIGNARSPAQITARAQSELGLVPLGDEAIEFVVEPTAPQYPRRIDR